MKIFISHAVADKALAEHFMLETQAATGLENSNFFFTSSARTGLRSSAPFAASIAQEYRAAHVAVYLVSPRFWKSKNCIIELGWALQATEKKIYIFELEPAPARAIPSMVSHINRLPYPGDYFKAFTQALGPNLAAQIDLCKKINSSIPPRKRPTLMPQPKSQLPFENGRFKGYT